MINFLYGSSKFIFYLLIDFVLIYLVVSIIKDMLWEKKHYDKESNSLKGDN